MTPSILFSNERIPLPRAISVTGIDIIDRAVAKDRAAELEGGVLPVVVVLSHVTVLMLVGSCVLGSASSCTNIC